MTATEKRIKKMLAEIDSKCGADDQENYSYIEIAHFALLGAICEVRKGNQAWQRLLNEITYQASWLAEESEMNAATIEKICIKLFADYAKKYNITACDLAA